MMYRKHIVSQNSITEFQKMIPKQRQLQEFMSEANKCIKTTTQAFPEMAIALSGLTKMRNALNLTIQLETNSLKKTFLWKLSIKFINIPDDDPEIQFRATDPKEDQNVINTYLTHDESQTSGNRDTPT